MAEYPIDTRYTVAELCEWTEKLIRLQKSNYKAEIYF